VNTPENGTVEQGYGSQREQEEAEVQTMLGLDKLPRQRVTAAEWQRYDERILAGDPEATEELLMRRVRTIYHTAKYFNALGSNEVSVEDLFQSAVEGFYEGVERHTDHQKRPLRQDIGWAIRSKLDLALRGGGLILNQNQQADIQTYNRQSEAAVEALGSVAANQDVIDGYVVGKTRFTLDDITDIKRAERTAAYESLLPGQAAETVADPEEPTDKAAINAAVASQLREALDGLSDRERATLKLRYGLTEGGQFTLDEVGLLLNITRERVRRVESNSLKKLSTLAAAQKLNDTTISLQFERKRPILKSASPQERAIARRLGFRAVGSESRTVLINPCNWAPEYSALTELIRRHG
jgi:RNA polymerase primary sigma factor